MSKTDNLTDFLTDVANAIRTKKGSEELINPQDFSYEILNLPSGSGDGTLPISVDTVNNVTFNDDVLSWNAGDYSDLAEYNPTITYLIVINEINVIESTTTSANISKYLEIGENTVSVKSKSTISVSDNQFNVALSAPTTIVISHTYLNIYENFTIDTTSTYYKYNDDFTFIQIDKINNSGPHQVNLEYKYSTNTYSKIEFELTHCHGGILPTVSLMYSINGTSWNTLETITVPNTYYGIESYTKVLPSGTVKFKFYIDLYRNNNYDPSVGVQNIKFS